MAESSSEDFLDAPEHAAPAYAEETLSAGPARRGLATWMSTGAWLMAGLVIGALVVAMLHTNKSTNATGLPAANQAPANQVPAGQAPNGQIPNGQIPNGPPAGGFGGGLPGEQHIVGTLTAVGSASITVASTGSTATYPIESSTLLVKDGQRVSSLSALKTGDSVVVHVYPENGSTHTEMVIDGVPSGGGGFGGRNDRGTTTET
jgi:hypothetical protein